MPNLASISEMVQEENLREAEKKMKIGQYQRKHSDVDFG
jgi:hypothetical protein